MTESDDLLPGPGSRDLRDLARGTVVNLAGMVARISRPLATAAATHLFGPAIYGLYDTGWKITFVLYKVARFGLQQGVARAVLEARVAGRDDDAADGAQGFPPAEAGGDDEIGQPALLGVRHLPADEVGDGAFHFLERLSGH